MILLVLDDPSKLTSVLSAWENAGTGGATILASTGMARLKNTFTLRDDLPIFPSFKSFSEQEENINQTLFTMVSNQAMVDAVVQATESVTGPLSDPHTGILAVLPVCQLYGVKDRTADHPTNQ